MAPQVQVILEGVCHHRGRGPWGHICHLTYKTYKHVLKIDKPASHIGPAKGNTRIQIHSTLRNSNHVSPEPQAYTFAHSTSSKGDYESEILQSFSPRAAVGPGMNLKTIKPKPNLETRCRG